MFFALCAGCGSAAGVCQACNKDPTQEQFQARWCLNGILAHIDAAAAGSRLGSLCACSGLPVMSFAASLVLWC
jgi:hypothetical protein